MKKLARIVAPELQNFSRNSAITTEQRPMQADDLISLVTKTMPFGKYEGRLLADLPGHYLGWFAREGFPRGEIGRLLALMYEIDHNNLRDLLIPLRKPISKP